MKKLTSLQIIMLMSLTLGSSAFAKYNTPSFNAIKTSVNQANNQLEDLLNTPASDPQAAAKIKAQTELLTTKLQNAQEQFNEALAIHKKASKDEQPIQNALAKGTTLLETLKARANDMISMPNIQEVQQLATNLADRLQISQQDAQEMIHDAFNVLMMADVQTLMDYKQIIMEKSPAILDQITERLADKLDITQQDANAMMAKAIDILSNAFQGIEYQAAIAARNIPGVQEQVAEKLANKLNIAKDTANDIINNIFAQDTINDDASQDNDEVVIQD